MNRDRTSSSSPIETDKLIEYIEILHKRPELRILFDKVKNAPKLDIEKTVVIIDILMNE